MRISVDADPLRSALVQFDRTLRDVPQWRGWESKLVHRYAIEYGGRRYPVKQILSMASGVPVSEFSGGRGPGQANAIATAAGFHVIDLRPLNPDWTRDEQVLALDFYLRHRRHVPDQQSKEVAELSRDIRRVGERLFTAEQRSDSFRNENGVYMKLMNFRRLDPEYVAQGKKGLARGARGEQEVWADFADDPKRCHAAAQAILAALDLKEVGSVEALPEFDSGIEEAAEGRLLTRLHLVRERNRELVAEKKRRSLKAFGRLACEACGFNFEQAYGDHGKGFIECHHTNPVSELPAGKKTRIEDLALVCSNCHRMIHRTRPWLSLEQVRALLRP